MVKIYFPVKSFTDIAFIWASCAFNQRLSITSVTLSRNPLRLHSCTMRECDFRFFFFILALRSKVNHSIRTVSILYMYYRKFGSVHRCRNVMRLGLETSRVTDMHLNVNPSEPRGMQLFALPRPPWARPQKKYRQIQIQNETQREFYSSKESTAYVRISDTLLIHLRGHPRGWNVMIGVRGNWTTTGLFREVLDAVPGKLADT